MNDISRAIALSSRLYGERAATAYAGYIQKDPMALLRLRPGRANPYPIYDRIRESGTLVPTRLGNWVSASHRVCDSVLRNRRFGVRLADGGAPSESGARRARGRRASPPRSRRSRWDRRCRPADRRPPARRPPPGVRDRCGGRSLASPRAGVESA